MVSNVAKIAVLAPSMSLSWNSVSLGTVSSSSAVKIPNIVVSTLPAGIPFVAGVGPGCPWLVLSSTSGVTPEAVSLGIGYTPSPGKYECKVSFNTLGGLAGQAVVSASVPVGRGTVDGGLEDGALFAVMPSVVTMVIPSGATELIHRVRLYVAGATSDTALQYHASVEGNTGWLSLESGAEGSVPGMIDLKVSTNGMSVGSYTGVVRVSVPGLTPSVLEVPIELLVNGSATTSP